MSEFTGKIITKPQTRQDLQELIKDLEADVQLLEAQGQAAAEAQKKLEDSVAASAIALQALQESLSKAAALIKMEQKVEAIEQCSEAIQLNPKYVKALLRRGQTYEETDKPHEAMKDFEQVLEIDPGHKEARMAVMRLPDKIKEKDEKLKEEMLSKYNYLHAVQNFFLI